MAYIGRPLQVANLAVQSGTGDGSDTTPIATLDYATTTNGIAVYLDGVRQLAGTDFNVTAQTTLTFTTAPANGVGVDVYFLGLELSIPTPADATVAKAKITTTLINEHVDTTITAADSILFSDATDSNANKKDTVQGVLDLVPAGGWAWVSEAVASTSATLAFTNMADGYDYLYVGVELTPTADADFYCEIGVSGPTYRTSGYLGVATRVSSSSNTSVATNATARFDINESGGFVGTDTGERIMICEVLLVNPAASGDKTVANTSIISRESASFYDAGHGGGVYDTAEANTAVQFKFASGNIESGEIQQYRRLRS
tara:strand:+ start:13 stop:957 length:945 start_codon:yes stop_codon:yes gene_type:complete